LNQPSRKQIGNPPPVGIFLPNGNRAITRDYQGADWKTRNKRRERREKSETAQSADKTLVIYRKVKMIGRTSVKIRFSGRYNRRNTYDLGRHFSQVPAGDNDTEKVASTENNQESSSPLEELEIKGVDNQIVFPWRHDEDPLPRLVSGTEEHAVKGHLLSSVDTPTGNSTLNAVTTAYMFLDLPIWQLIFFGAWKQDLTESTSWAFTQSMTNLLSKLSNTSSSRDDAVTIDSDEIDFEDIIHNPEERSTELDRLSPMLEAKFLEIYKTSTTNAGEAEICLKCKPHSAELISLYCIPYISRSNVLEEASLVAFYRSMLEKRAMDRQEDLALLRKDYMETGRMESTVIAQVMVWCNEIFYVKDKNTGDLLQGQDDETSKNVPHLVRMEMTVKTEKGNNGGFLNSQSNWIITDIDDLVEGNLIV
jgi:hypothetical protein